MSHKVWLDQEVTEGGITYSIQLEAELEFRNEEDPECCHVEITKAEVSPLDGEPMPLEYEGRRIEKVIVTGHPELTEAIDTALWDEVSRFAEDNLADLARDMRYERDERDL